LEALLAAGADLNAVSEDGFTAMMIAAQHGHTEIAELLRRAGSRH
jgi:ankyrin repeat protein